MTNGERPPANRAPKCTHWGGTDACPANSTTASVTNTDCWETMADASHVTASDLMALNFGTTDPYEVNYYLHFYLGCPVAPDKINYMFSSSAKHPVIHIPLPPPTPSPSPAPTTTPPPLGTAAVASDDDGASTDVGNPAPRCDAHWITIQLKPVVGARNRPSFWPSPVQDTAYGFEFYRAEITDGHRENNLSRGGLAAYYAIPPGNCQIKFPDIYKGLRDFFEKVVRRGEVK